MSDYRRLQIFALVVAIALIGVNAVTAYLSGIEVHHLIFISLGMVVIALRGDLAGRYR